MKAMSYMTLNNCLYVIPIGDIHIGDPSFDKKGLVLLNGYLDWVKEHSNSVIVLMGDMFNTATRDSKTNPHEQTIDLDHQIEYLVNLLEPVREQVIGAIDGNHEIRAYDYLGFSPVKALCTMIKAQYFKSTGVINFKLGVRNRNGRAKTNVSYVGVFHHTTGGGATVGGKMNRIDKMRSSTITNGDFYVGGHNHMLGNAVPVGAEYDARNNSFVYRHQYLIDAGSYLEWNNSYAEAKQLPPMKLGSPRIRLDGTRKDIHVSI